MALDTKRVLDLLAAGEDALQALRALRALIEREAELAAQRGESGFDNLLLMGQEAFLLREPSATPLALAQARAYYTPTRLGINRRARAKRAKQKEQKG